MRLSAGYDSVRSHVTAPAGADAVTFSLLQWSSLRTCWRGVLEPVTLPCWVWVTSSSQVSSSPFFCASMSGNAVSSSFVANVGLCCAKLNVTYDLMWEWTSWCCVRASLCFISFNNLVTEHGVTWGNKERENGNKQQELLSNRGGSLSSLCVEEKLSNCVFSCANLTHCFTHFKCQQNESLTLRHPNTFSHSYPVIFSHIYLWNAPSLSGMRAELAQTTIHTNLKTSNEEVINEMKFQFDFDSLWEQRFISFFSAAWRRTAGHISTPASWPTSLDWASPYLLCTPSNTHRYISLCRYELSLDVI